MLLGEKSWAYLPDFFWWVPLSMSHLPFFFCKFFNELNEAGTSFKKPSSLVFCNYSKTLLVSRKHQVTKEGMVRTRESMSIQQAVE